MNTSATTGSARIALADDTELAAHFKFGENWGRLLPAVDETRVAAAVQDIVTFIGSRSLAGLSFLDVGCGSGLSSLAAFRLGATPITSVDIDPLNIRNLENLRRRFAVPEDARWQAFTASILEPGSAPLKPADIVYSWGVLHHTGAMWRAIDNCAALVNPGGLLYLMLCRDAWCAPMWRRIKRSYTRGGRLWQGCLARGFAGLLLTGLMLKGRNPLRVMRDYAKSGRGVSWYVDVVDWVGGYPFEYTSPQQLIAYLKDRGFRLLNISPDAGDKPFGLFGTGDHRYLFRRVRS